MAKMGRRPTTEVSGRELLLQSGLRWFAKNGFEDASLRKIAKDVGVDAALVNRLFGSKKQLWYAVVGELKTKQNESILVLNGIIDKQDTSTDVKVNQYLELIVEIAFEIPELGAFIAQEILDPGERLDYLKSEIMQPFITSSSPLLEKAKKEGLIRCSRPEFYVKLLMSSISYLIDYAVLYGKDDEQINSMKSDILYEVKSIFLV